MFHIKELCCRLMRQPIEAWAGEHAAPTFEMPCMMESRHRSPTAP